ncbi:hypothetical protein ACTXT7_009820 [Hymenolepis weldensis]
MLRMNIYSLPNSYQLDKFWLCGQSQFTDIKLKNRQYSIGVPKSTKDNANPLGFPHLSDQGGGFPRSLNDQLFKYTYTTGGSRTGRSESILSPSAGYAPIAGYGYGLPLSRLYARYLHGDLSLSGTEGYGTEAFLYLMSQAADADEYLPVFNRTSARRYESVGIPVDDWIHRTGSPTLEKDQQYHSS